MRTLPAVTYALIFLAVEVFALLNSSTLFRHLQVQKNTATSVISTYKLTRKAFTQHPAFYINPGQCNANSTQTAQQNIPPTPDTLTYNNTTQAKNSALLSQKQKQTAQQNIKPPLTIWHNLTYGKTTQYSKATWEKQRTVYYFNSNIQHSTEQNCQTQHNNTAQACTLFPPLTLRLCELLLPRSYQALSESQTASCADLL